MRISTCVDVIAIQVYPDPYTRFGITSVSHGVFDAVAKVVAVVALYASHLILRSVVKTHDAESKATKSE